MSVFVKVCGITSEKDALGAVAMGADALGFVFAPSKRQIDRKTAGDIIRRLPREVLNVGIFQNHSKENVARITHEVGLKAVQLHGFETPEETRWLKDRVPYVIKSFVNSSPQLMNAQKWGADVILIDGENPGSGQIFDWATAENAPTGMKILLAGGLTPENVGDAIRRVKPWGVDISTGVEMSPGKKDLSAIQAFVKAAKSALNEDQAEDQSAHQTTHQSTSSENTKSDIISNQILKDVGQPFDWDEDLESFV